MAKESNEVLLDEGICEPEKRVPRRNSTGIVKSNSTGTSSSPNYLRASTGSCHDFCKYGRERSFAVKARSPIPKRMTPPSEKQKSSSEVLTEKKNTSAVKTPPSDMQKDIRSEDISEKKKTSAIKINPSRDLKIHSPNQNNGNVAPVERKKTLMVKLKPSLHLTHLPEPPETIKQEILLPFKKVEVSSTQNSSKTKTMKHNKMKIPSPSKCSPASNSKPVKSKPSSSSAISVGLIGTRKSAIKVGRPSGTSKTSAKKSLAPPVISVSPRSSGNRTVSLYARKFSSQNLISPPKDQHRKQKVESKKPDHDKVQEKTSHVETDTMEKKLESGRSDGINQISPPSPQVQSPLSYPDSQFLSSHGDDVEEADELIDKEDLEDSEYTDREDLEESEYTESEADEGISENDELGNIIEADTTEGNHTQSPIKGKAITSEYNGNALSKSKFRRGRIVDLQGENNTPRKLRFRRGRVVGDNDESKNDEGRRRFKKREVVNDANGGSSNSEKVVLRHQETQGKKDATQGLFNNVIEETASKLVESRKSKVKALVGAFETVISLQESKPSTQMGA